jgi:hypothetical protein
MMLSYYLYKESVLRAIIDETDPSIRLGYEQAYKNWIAAGNKDQVGKALWKAWNTASKELEGLCQDLSNATKLRESQEIVKLRPAIKQIKTKVKDAYGAYETMASSAVKTAEIELIKAKTRYDQALREATEQYKNPSQDRVLAEVNSIHPKTRVIDGMSAYETGREARLKDTQPPLPP